MTRTDQRARSRSRLGADFARVWARELCLRNPHAKAVLLAVANYMNEDGSAFPGIGTIARDTDLSEDTVVGRLRWLERVAAIALFKCWVDENGRRNYDGRGRVTASEIRFLYEADADAIEDAAREDSKPQSLRGAAAESAKQIRDQGDAGTRHRREQTPVDDSVISTGLAPGQHPPPAARTEEQEVDSPQKPPLAGDDGPPVQSETGTGYERFAEAYGDGSVRPERARALWEALSEFERDLAIRGARGYRAQRHIAKKSLMDPERFLRDQALWREFATKPSADAASIVLAPIEDRAGQAWGVLHAIAGAVPRRTSAGGREVFVLPCEASEQLLALARFANQYGRPSDDRTWWDVTGQAAGAWREFVAKAIGKPIRAGPIMRVPRPFPPRVDGTWSDEASNHELQKAG